MLLQNQNHSLPISLHGKTVALFGPFAAARNKSSAGPGHEPTTDPAEEALVGSYVLSGAHVVTIDAALRAAGVSSLTYQPGAAASGPAGSGTEDLAAAVALAKQSDVSILVLGDGSGTCGEWQDRDSLDLAGGQLQLLEAVAAVAKKTIVVLVHGRPQTFGPGNKVLETVDAMISAWRPGEEGGNAIVNILTGKTNPSGGQLAGWVLNVLLCVVACSSQSNRDNHRVIEIITAK